MFVCQKPARDDCIPIGAEAGGQPALTASEALLLATAGPNPTLSRASGSAPQSSLYSSLFERRGGGGGGSNGLQQLQQQQQAAAWGSEKVHSSQCASGMASWTALQSLFHTFLTPCASVIASIPMFDWTALRAWVRIA